jgi:hypothetical protein
MRRKSVPLAARESHAIRFAWLVSFLATIALIALLGLARSAQAASGVPIVDPLLAATGVEPEDDEEAEAASEEDEAIEECEVTDGEADCEEAKEEETDVSCLLREAEATVVVVPSKDVVRMSLRYATFHPAVVSVRFSLRGRRGRLAMGGESRRFGRRGVLREAEKLTETEMARAKAATEFDVQIHAVNTPRYCRERFERRLTSRRAAHGGLSWTE